MDDLFRLIDDSIRLDSFLGLSIYAGEVVVVTRGKFTPLSRCESCQTT